MGWRPPHGNRSKQCGACIAAAILPVRWAARHSCSTSARYYGSEPDVVVNVTCADLRSTPGAHDEVDILSWHPVLNLGVSYRSSQKGSFNMYRIVWEFAVKPEALAEFEGVYGPNGQWTRFFRRSPDYVGTEFFRSTTDPVHFMTLDAWRSRVAYEQFRKTYADEYAALDKSCERLIERERTLGVTDDGRD